ncbi:MAG: S8 family serine peptidase [Halobacteriales archaeon]|nr:S8 family serine peptidase [Halobacteriales archaeon]
MRPTTRSLRLLAALALLVPLAPIVAPAAPMSGDLVLVRGAHGEQAIPLAGAHLVDAYGAFATAHASPASAQALRAQGFAVEPLRLTTGRGAFRFDPQAGDGIVPSPLRSPDAGHRLVSFRGPVQQGWRDALDRAATVYDYLPADSFVVRPRASMAGLPGVAFIGPYHAGYKLAPGILAAEGAQSLTVLTFPDEDLAAAARAIAATGASVLDTGSVAGLEGIIKVRADASQAARIAQLDSVAWLEPTPGSVGTDNEHATAIVQGGDPNTRTLNLQGVDGSSQVVSICDTGVDTTGTAGTARMVHDMFNDPANPTVTFQQANPLHRKVALYYAPVEGGTTKGDFDDGDGHGTHTGGTIAGDIAPWGQPDNHDSGAYAAKLAVCDIVIGTSFQVPNDYSLMWAPAYALGARVNSNSWGSSTGFAYTDVSRQHDAYVSAHRDFVITRSAGNTGTAGMRPESLAKDVLSVASGKNTNSGNIEDLSTFSSTGPALDGRLKPDIAAPGECLMSALQGSTNQYVCESGTSMATPTAAAAAALLRDYFAKGYWPGGFAGSGPAIDPSTALVRALFFASGHEMTGAGAHPGLYLGALASEPNGAALLSGLGRIPGSSTFLGPIGSFPNPAQGWGRLDLAQVLPFAGGQGLWFEDEAAGLGSGDSQSFTVHVGADQPLRVVLAWTDVAGAAGADPALVNDLDLVVTDPAGLTYAGNLWLKDASLPLVPLADHVNNAEGIELAAPLEGDWTVTVSGGDVPSGPQSFAVVATGAVG